MDLRNVSKSFLRPLIQLSHLYIRENPIYELEEDVFEVNQFLEVLDLSRNNLDQLPESLGMLMYLRICNFISQLHHFCRKQGI